MKVGTIVSADLPGIRNASGHPVRWSIMGRMCLLPELEVSHSVTKLWQSCRKGILEFLSSVEGKPEPLLFLISKVYSEQCISLYPLSVYAFPIVLSFY